MRCFHCCCCQITSAFFVLEKIFPDWNAIYYLWNNQQVGYRFFLGIQKMALLSIVFIIIIIIINNNMWWWTWEKKNFWRKFFNFENFYDRQSTIKTANIAFFSVTGKYSWTFYWLLSMKLNEERKKNIRIRIHSIQMS